MFGVKKRPTLTVILQARTPKRIFEWIEKGIAGGADAFGLQVEQLEPAYRTETVFREIFKAAEDKPVYVTNYRGGLNAEKSDEELAEELLMIAKIGGKLYDVPGDMFCPEKDQITFNTRALIQQKTLIAELKRLGKEVLISSHTYRYLPAEDAIKILLAQREHGADVAKLVTMASNEQELQSNMELSARLAKALDFPHLFLCGGDFCHKHRRLAPFLNNGLFLCVAEHDELSTPFQPLLGEARQLIDLIVK